MSEALAYSELDGAYPDARVFEWRTYLGSRAVSGFIEYLADEYSGEEPEGASDSSTWYDVVNHQLIVGRPAYEQRLAEGSHPLDLRPLGELLREDPMDIERVSSEPDFDKWSRQDIINFGKWVYEKAADEKDRNPINESVIRVARRLGLGPSLHRIVDEFGGAGNFYQEAELPGAKRQGAFEDWTEEDYIRYIQETAERLGKKPTFKDLWRLSQENIKNPSPGYIAAKFNGDRHVGIGVAIERAGFPNIYTWTKGNYVSWGVDYMLANDGEIPTASKMNFLSKKKVGPSARATMNNFNLLTTYQAECQAAYEWEIQLRNERNKELLSEINRALKEKTLSSAVAKDIESPDELLARYAKYKVAVHLGINKTKAENAMTLGNDELLDFLNGNTTREQIEAGAKEIDVHRYIWPRNIHLNRLRIGYWKARPSRRVIKNIDKVRNINLRKYAYISKAREQEAHIDGSKVLSQEFRDGFVVKKIESVIPDSPRVAGSDEAKRIVQGVRKSHSKKKSRKFYLYDQV